MEIFISAFVTLLVIVDPPGMAPIFAGLTDGSSAKHKRAMALKGSLVATLILVFFGLVGKAFITVLGITMDGMRVAGGIMLFIVALEMVMEKRMERKQETAEKMDDYFNDISVFPVALPMLAGPGAIASIMLLMNDVQGDIIGQAYVMGALLSVMLLTVFALLLAPKMMDLLGPSVNGVITRVLGVILAALAVQFIIDGIKGAFLPS